MALVFGIPALQRILIVEHKKGTARYRSPNPSLLSILFSPAFFCFCSGREAYCIVVCCYGVVDGLGLAFKANRPSLFLLFFSFPLHHNLIKPNITSILDHFFVEF